MAELTDEHLDKQQHLSIERLKLNLSPGQHKAANRPESSLLMLMHWAKDTFGLNLNKRSNLKCYIHNRIAVDGSFITFCEEKKVELKCLHLDSIASWKDNASYESFIAQGVFKISKNNSEFIHCALFHKGNQNEDEVSFFVIVDDSQYEQYINFRNDYDDWLTSRDRDITDIQVVGGEPISYSKELTWDDLFLEESIKEEIKTSIDGFFSAEKVYKKAKVPWKRGLLFWGDQGCGKTTTIRVILSQYDFKPVTIQPGLPNPDQALEEAFSYAERHGPSLVFLEDLADLLTVVNLSHFLQLIDGIEARDGVFIIATGNDIEKIQHNVTDRPSRFDRKIEFPLPNEKMCEKYLKKWFGQTISDDFYVKISKSVSKKNFSYAYLKELYFSSVFEAIKNNRETPNEEDINSVLLDLSKQKTSARRGHLSSSSKKLDVTQYVEE